MGTTLLHYACKLNYLDVAKLLITGAANPNSKGKIDDTPLHCAVQNGNTELVDLLIRNGADPNYTTELGETIFDNWPPWAEDKPIDPSENTMSTENAAQQTVEPGRRSMPVFEKIELSVATRLSVNVR